MKSIERYRLGDVKKEDIESIDLKDIKNIGELIGILKHHKYLDDKEWEELF